MTFEPSIGDGAQLMDIMQLQATLAGYHLIDPDGVTIEPGSDPLTIDVEFETEARLGGPAAEIDDETGLELPDPDPDGARKALVYVDSSGDVQTEGGIPAPADPDGEERTRTVNPQVPVPDGEFLPLAEVWLEAGASDISAGDISSRRLPFEMGVGSGLVSNDVQPQGEGSGIDADTIHGLAPESLYTPVFGDGADGEIVHDSDTTESGVIWADGYTVDEGVTVDVDEQLVIVSKRPVRIDGEIDAKGEGAEPGENRGFFESNGTPGSGGGGGRGGDGGDGTDGAGGGGGGDSARVDPNSGSDGNPPDDRDVDDDERERLQKFLHLDWDEWYETTFPGGAAGGSGGDGNSEGVGPSPNDGGAGGPGGGVIVIAAPEITGSGTVIADGGDGEDGEDGHGAGGGGGGGTGGLILLVAPVIDIEASVEGGKGGAGGDGGSGGDGGDGGDGEDGEVVIITTG